MEITGQELSLVWSTGSAIEWVFEVTVEVNRPCNGITAHEMLECLSKIYLETRFIRVA